MRHRGRHVATASMPQCCQGPSPEACAPHRLFGINTVELFRRVASRTPGGYVQACHSDGGHFLCLPLFCISVYPHQVLL